MRATMENGRWKTAKTPDGGVNRGGFAHCPRSADLQSAVSRICNPQGVNSSTAVGQLARRRLQIGDTAGFKPALRGQCQDAPVIHVPSSILALVRTVWNSY